MFAYISVLILPLIVIGYITITPASTSITTSDSANQAVNSTRKDVLAPPIIKENLDQRLQERPNLSNTLLFQGNWFDVQYPKDFKLSLPDVVDQTKTQSSYTETDEATFISPDESVEFFVYSPIWSGDPIDYLNIKPNEEKVSEKIDEAKNEQSVDPDQKNITTWVTIKDKNNSYLRSYISVREVGSTNTHYVFGIKYKDEASYQKYKQEYIDFKKSLVQYLD